MRSAEWGEWGAECGVLSAGCGGRGAECGVGVGEVRRRVRKEAVIFDNSSIEFSNPTSGFM